MPDFHLPPYELLNMLSAAEVGETLPWSISDYGIQKLWEQGDYGEHALVGIVDTGCSLDHPEFAGRIVGTHGGRWGTAEDYNGHGSHVAGTIAAGHNSTGVAGVAPKAKLFIAKGLGKEGSGSGKDIASAIRACVDAGCHIVNLSLGSPGEDKQITREIERGVNAGVTFVCAAGNEGPGTNSWPAMLSIVVSQGAIDRQKKLAKFSTTNGEVDFVGPGVKIISTYKGGKYATLSGTSMATPWLAGLAALLVSYEIKTTGKRQTTGGFRFIEAVRVACDDLGRSGRDPETGYGVPIPSRLFKSQPSKPVEQSGFDWMGLLGVLLKAVFEQLLRGK